MRPDWAIAVVTCLSLTLASPAAALLVVDVGAGGEAARAGIQTGDRLTAWSAATNPDRVQLTTPHDLEVVEIENVPRAKVILHGQRNGETVAFELEREDWRLITVPDMPARSDTLFQAVRAGSLVDGAWHRLLRLRDEALRRGDDGLYCWLSERMAIELSTQGDVQGISAILGTPADSGRAVRELAAVMFNELRARTHLRHGSLPAAEAALADGMRLTVGTAGDSLFLTRLLYRSGVAAWQRGDVNTADARFRRALEIRHRLAADSLSTADSLNSVGLVAWRSGRLHMAARLFEGAMTIAAVHRPRSMIVASYLNNLGLIARAQGDLALAQERYQQALGIRERLEPTSAHTAATLNNLGNLARTRGDIISAESYHLRSIAIKEQLVPDSVDLAVSWINLGNVARRREDYDRAEQRYRRAVEILTRISPDSIDLAGALHGLGQVAFDRGDLEAAETFGRRAMEIRERAIPDSLDFVESLTALGRIDLVRGRHDAAATMLERAHEMLNAIAPGSVNVAGVLKELSTLAENRQDLELAGSLLRDALVLHQRLAPGSREEANTLHDLGRLCLEQDRAEEALRYLEQAVAALEVHKTRLGGGSDAAERLSQSTTDCYRDLVELQLRLNQTTAAFHSLERFRARALLEMLAERDLDFGRDAAPDLLMERRRAALEHARLQDQLCELNIADARNEAEHVRSLLLEIGDARRRIDEQIRQASPRLAALQNPEPVGVEESARILGPGSLLLSYSTGQRGTRLLALLDGELAAFDIPITRSELTSAVRRSRMLMTSPRTGSTALDRSTRELHRLLVAPALEFVDEAERVVVCADGPLHYLPFATLSNSSGRYLVEDRPLFNVLSMTVLGEQRRQDPNPRQDRVMAAFGDPVYTGGGPGSARSVDLGAGLHDMPPLPATRLEVERIAESYPARTRLYLGAAASESQAKELDRVETHVHFACHAVLDDRFPLNSGLLLSAPTDDTEVDNGLLQAWEIFEAMRLDAELVTLSACETGLGVERGGEGLVGLTRAFLYAGARSVVSSLWQVPDTSTADLMTHFYEGLAAGSPKAQSLRLAQLEVAGRATDAPPGGSASDTSHPFYWGAFQLVGDGW